jgi:hypothetical protein
VVKNEKNKKIGGMPYVYIGTAFAVWLRKKG